MDYTLCSIWSTIHANLPIMLLLLQVAPAIKAHMQEKGSMLVGYQPQGKFVNFFRMVVANSSSTKQDMDYVIETVSSYGEMFFK